MKKIFSMIALMLMTAVGAMAQTYTVTVKDGTEDAANWSATPNPAEAGQTVTIKYTGTKKVKSIKAVKKASAPSVNLSSPTVGQVIGSDGKNYTAGSVPSGIEIVAVIVYLNGTSGLALALNDEANTMSWADANTAATNATPQFTNATWRVPTTQDWWNIFGKSGDVNTNNSLMSMQLPGYILGAGGSNFREGQAYWSGSGVGGREDRAWTLNVANADENNVVAIFFDMPKARDNVYVRLCLAF